MLFIQTVPCTHLFYDLSECEQMKQFLGENSFPVSQGNANFLQTNAKSLKCFLPSHIFSIICPLGDSLIISMFLVFKIKFILIFFKGTFFFKCQGETNPYIIMKKINILLYYKKVDLSIKLQITNCLTNHNMSKHTHD